MQWIDVYFQYDPYQNYVSCTDAKGDILQHNEDNNFECTLLTKVTAGRKERD